MKLSTLRRSTFGVCAAAAILAGCGSRQSQDDMQPPIGGQGTSWMSPEASKTDLIYVTGPEGSYSIVYVYSYPAAKLEGKIIHAISGFCTDKDGDIFMTQSWYSASRILEYAHGGRKPIGSLSDSYQDAAGCAVNPKNGDLAVANPGEVLIYPHAKGPPKAHLIWFAPEYVAYDSQGILFAFGSSLAVLGGNGQFEHVKNPKHVDPPMGIQWDGQYIALGQGTITTRSSYGSIRRYKIDGRSLVLQSTVGLESQAYGFDIHGSKVFVAGGNEVNIFDYPAGGHPIQSIAAPANGSIILSVAP